MGTSIIPLGTIQAYRETHYQADTVAPLVLRIDQANPDLVELHRQHGCSCSAYVTACNPFSESLDAQTNEYRQSELGAVLKSRGLTYFTGTGRHPYNGWPGEASFLMLGVDLSAARELGTQFGQNAIVWCDRDAVPQLILLR